MPEHRVLDISVYTALTHEAFHAFYLANTTELYAIFDEFINSGRTISHQTTPLSRARLLEEMVVELLDFVFGYLGSYSDYMQDEWYFFSKQLNDTIKSSFAPRDLVHYILRTFITPIWLHTVENDILSVSEVINMPPLLRDLLRKHLSLASSIASNTNPKIAGVILDSLVTNSKQISYRLPALSKLSLNGLILLWIGNRTC